MMALTALSVLSLLTLVAGYSFDITAAPTQCGPLSLKITNGSGKPPYTAIVIPSGAAPGGKPEQRKVFQQQFSDSSTSFALPYPANSNFIVMVGDSDGIGSGGTSVPTGVQSSSNSSCLPGSVSTDFSFQIINGPVNQCTPVILAWTGEQDPVSLYLVIPGGQSQTIAITNPGQQQGTTTGFSWTPNIAAQTNIIIVANDNRGVGTGGSAPSIVGFSNKNDNSCLTGGSPSSTAGTPAGAVQTGSSGGGGGGGGGGNGGNDNSGGGGGGGGTNIGAIVGGVVGGLAAIAIAGLLALFCVRRRRRARHPAAHGVDLLPDGAHRDPDHPPEFYQPEPFIVPPHSHTGADENAGTSAGRPSMSDVGRRYSALSTEPTDQSESAYLGVGAPSGSSNVQSSSRKSPSGASQLRPVNFVQHEDAGEAPEQSGSAAPAETIELPPSYTSVRPPKAT